MQPQSDQPVSSSSFLKGVFTLVPSSQIYANIPEQFYNNIYLHMIVIYSTNRKLFTNGSSSVLKKKDWLLDS